MKTVDWLIGALAVAAGGRPHHDHEANRKGVASYAIVVRVHLYMKLIIEGSLFYKICQSSSSWDRNQVCSENGNLNIMEIIFKYYVAKLKIERP